MENGRLICRPGNKRVLFLALFLLAGAALPHSNISEGSLRRQRELTRRTSACQDGDLVFRYGNGFWSPYFRDASPVHKRFSHAGVIVFRNGLPWVMHAEANSLTGVGKAHMVTLEEYLAEASDYAFFRLDAPRILRARIAAVAVSYTGRPFDTSFDTQEASKLYCSELVMHAVNEGCGHPVIRPSVIRGISIVTIDDCYRDPHVKEIMVSGGTVSRLSTSMNNKGTE
jgi:hypothetical protein